ncbi:hypothetical protein PCASD_25909 [Puccinia coronata f. sp. avenae]|uniref:Reverse transcriptase domain-containing protein n=1 Tax=Puccinia coronata f. sp. avenae TaxID=200324 RepID=A0A2N5THH9_9BASI|nr:hypothetical protein PCASD_25909 [Puccinia coronata f. sp. avenae]
MQYPPKVLLGDDRLRSSTQRPQRTPLRLHLRQTTPLRGPSSRRHGKNIPSTGVYSMPPGISLCLTPAAQLSDSYVPANKARAPLLDLAASKGGQLGYRSSGRISSAVNYFTPCASPLEHTAARRPLLPSFTNSATTGAAKACLIYNRRPKLQMTAHLSISIGPSSSSPSYQTGGGARLQLGAHNQARGLERRNSAFEAFRGLRNQEPPVDPTCITTMTDTITGTNGGAPEPSIGSHIPPNEGLTPSISASPLPEGGRGERLLLSAHLKTSSSASTPSTPTHSVSPPPDTTTLSNPAKIAGCTRFLLTNVGSISTPMMWQALKKALSHHPPSFRGIVRVKPTLQPNRRRRFDLWVKNEVAAGLQRALQLHHQGRKHLTSVLKANQLPWRQLITNMMLPRYRLCRWKSYRDRTLTKSPQKPPIPPTALRSFLTWNINGIGSKLPMLKEILKQECVSVAGIQEHVRGITQYAPGIPNYILFDRPKEAGFRGHCLYVHSSLNAHEVITDNRHLIYVKIFGLTGAKPWHVLSVYMPSGNLRRTDRAAVWEHLKQLLEGLDPTANVTLMGDFNQDTETISRILERGSLSHLHLQVSKDPSADHTHRIRHTPGRYIDHFINSPKILGLIPHPRVDTTTTDISDHWPVFLPHTKTLTKTPPTRKVWNRKLLSGHGINLALSHKWDCLKTEEIDSQQELDEAAALWVTTLNQTGEELHLLAIPRERQQLSFDRTTLNAINKSKLARKAYLLAQQTGDLPLILRKRGHLDAAANRAKLAIKKFAQKTKLLKAQRLNSLLVENEAADFHKIIQQAQGKSTGAQGIEPCFNSGNRLATTTSDILQARAEYSATLAADPTTISRDPNMWTHLTPAPPPQEPLHISRIVTEGSDTRGMLPIASPLRTGLDADALLMAIRQMKRNATPGKSGLLTMHLKKFLEIECQLQTSESWATTAETNVYGKHSYPKPLDYSTVALPRWDLPRFSLKTPPLHHLLQILRACIRLKTQPAIWNEEILITLPKPGQDSRYLKNTRGITLSCTEGKLLLTILARDIADKLELAGFFTSAQAGFRRGQEAMAHVISLHEILKRRRNANLTTYALYIDFKKAFDRVPHEGMWARLLNIGIHPDMVELIRQGYNNSTIQCRLGDQLSDPFTREIGTRQGCPLSPLLFIIYVNDILDSVTRGIRVPGLPRPAKGLLFADDTLIFADNPAMIQTICNNLDQYCTNWHFAIGHDKCGVVRLLGSQQNGDG